jgi:hypothetical protein
MFSILDEGAHHMDKGFWKGFLRFLDQASPEELNRKIADVELLLQNTRSAEVKSDAKRMIRFMEQELFAGMGNQKQKK